MLCSICIATYQRPKLLEKLLISISNLQTLESQETEVIIVDNDINESARSVFEHFTNSYHNLKYFVQPLKNISITRNEAVRNAKGQYIAFIDDDEHAEPDWLTQLVDTIEKYNADVVIGRIISEFPPNTAEWVKSTFLFNRLAAKTGEKPYYTYTGNCIIRRSVLEKLEGPFDVRYGISGGEDTQLFSRIHLNGGKIVSCYEAVTYEFVPKERTRLLWQIKRAFRVGNNYCRRVIEFTERNKTITSIQCSIQSFLYAFVSLLLMLFYFPFRIKRIHWFLKIFTNLGKFTAVFGFQSKEYKANQKKK